MKRLDPGRPLTLAFDAVGAEGGLALLLPGGRVLSRDLGERNRQAEALLPVALGLLQEAGCGWGDLSLVAVNVGPGSFTGIRVGLAAALGIHAALGLPAVGVGCLDSVAHACYDATSPRIGSYMVCSADVRRGEVVQAGFRVERDGPVRLDADRLTVPASSEMPEEGTILAGDAALLLWPQGVFTRWVPTGVARAAATARLGSAAWLRGEAGPAEPRYARGADARPRVG